eukprot:4074443-Amphidinium_carterae.1
MSSIDRRSLTHDDTSLLLECGSFWPDSMVDKSSFMQMLLHALNVEANDTQRECWEKILTASGACNASGVVDVKHIVAFCRRSEIVQGGLSRPQQEDEILAAASEPLSEMLAATNTNPSKPLGRDTSLISSTMSTAKTGEQIPLPLPLPEDQ